MLSYIITKSFLVLCAWLPLPVLHGIARIWGSALSIIPNRSHATTRTNLKACFPDYSAAEISRLTRASLVNTACTVMEMGKAWLAPIEKTLNLVVDHDVDGMQSFSAAVESGSGVILLAPHLSNWEILGFYIQEIYQTTFLYQPLKQPALDKMIRDARSRNGVQMAPTNRKGVAQLLKALQSGEIIAVLPDQVPADESGMYAPFFGVPALTMTLVSKLTQRTGAKVFCGFAQRLPKGRGFKVVLQEANPTVFSNNLEESIAGLNESVEKSVELAVAQYQWEYKRFRRQPDGEKFYQK
ncbi:MAG: lysophospholipid acyltransferase family protein [Gammaproteobacteria bacterium]|nr:lysophospholipid acyltransferase family protein [Gammaproteobacteria bacterium]MDP6651483.1 lysophospholipid acyltransferase family protein [Gammaproteobacteria bacterium]